MLSRYQIKCDSSAMERQSIWLSSTQGFALSLPTVPMPRVPIECDYFGVESSCSLSLSTYLSSCLSYSLTVSFVPVHRCIWILVSQTQTHSSSMTSCKHEIFPILFAIVILLERYTIISHLNECMSPVAAINNKRTIEIEIGKETHSIENIEIFQRIHNSYE